MSSFFKIPAAFFLLIWLAAPVRPAFGQSPGPSIHGEYSAAEARHWTGGAGDKTLLKRGDFFTTDLKLKIDEPLEDGWDFLTDVHVRKTEDPQIDTRRGFHLLGLTSEIYNRFLRFTFGDFFADFTQYTMQSALKGFQMAAKTDDSGLKVVAGYANKGDEGKQFMRWVFGGRAETVLVREYRAVKDLKGGFNFSAVEDAHDSIGNKAGVKDASNRVGSVNAQAVVWNNTEIQMEAAKAWIDEDTSPDNGADRGTGSALRLGSSTKFDKSSKLKLGYEWVSAAFNTLAGSAVPDRVNFTSRFDKKWGEEWKSEMGYRVYYDKLDKSALNKRTVTQSPRLALNWEPRSLEGWIKDVFARIFWELRSRQSQDDPSGQTDFLSNDFGFEDEFKIERITWSSGLTVRTEKDDFQNANDRRVYTGTLGVRGHEKFIGMDASPSLRYQFNYDDRYKEGGRDLTQSVAAGLNLDISDSIRFEQRFSVETASRLAADSDTVRLNAYAALDYRLPTKQDLTLHVSYEHGNYFHPSATERFSEDNLEARLLWKF